MTGIAYLHVPQLYTASNHQHFSSPCMRAICHVMCIWNLEVNLFHSRQRFCKINDTGIFRHNLFIESLASSSSQPRPRKCACAGLRGCGAAPPAAEAQQQPLHISISQSESPRESYFGKQRIHFDGRHHIQVAVGLVLPAWPSTTHCRSLGPSLPPFIPRPRARQPGLG